MVESSGVKIVTQIGAITKNKRQNILISVIANLKNFGEDVVGLIVGDTVTEADRIFKRELEQQIEESGIKIKLSGWDLDQILEIF